MSIDPIKELRRALEESGQVRFEVADDSVRIPPADEDGFEVSLARSSSGYMVCFEGWHEEFADAEEALRCAAFGLSDEARLRVALRGSCPYRWTLEYRRGSEWVPESEVGLLFFPLWRRKTVKVLQNRLRRTT